MASRFSSCDGILDTGINAADNKNDKKLKAPLAAIDKYEQDEESLAMIPATVQNTEIPGTFNSPVSGHDAECSEAEEMSLGKIQAAKRHYSGDGTAEEAEGMSVSDTAETRGNLWEKSSETTGARARAAGHDLHDIELQDFQTEGDNSDHMERAEAENSADRENEASIRIHRFIQLIQNFFRNLSRARLAILTAVVAIIVGIALILGLVPASFVYIEYHELALSVNRVTGRVNRNVTYYPGCYLLTPGTGLIRFDGTAHFLMKNLDVATSDQLNFNLGISLQYFIKPEELGLLFNKYAHNYGEVVEAVVESTVKNAATKFSLDTFRLYRSFVEQDFQREISNRLSGDCCPACCSNHCGLGINCSSCAKLPGHCYQGHHVEVRYFQMLAVDIPNDVAEGFLKQTLLMVEAEREVFVQQHAIEEKISEKLQKDILNNVTEIKEMARADAVGIQAEALASYEKEIQSSYLQAMNRLYQRLNITHLEHKLSLMYIRALEDSLDNIYSLFSGPDSYRQGLVKGEGNIYFSLVSSSESHN